MKEVVRTSSKRYYLLKDLDRNKIVSVEDTLFGNSYQLGQLVKVKERENLVEGRIVEIRKDANSRFFVVKTSTGKHYVKPSEIFDIYETR